MRDIEIKSAQAVLNRALDRLLTFRNDGGRDAADLRRLVGALQGDAEALIKSATVAQRMTEAFEAATLAGAIVADWRVFRAKTDLEPVINVADALMKNGCLQLALIEEVKIISQAEFRSRSEVTKAQNDMVVAFDRVIETASDDRSGDVVREMTTLHATVVHHLNTVSSPLPEIVDYGFARRLPAVVIAHKLYQDAGRADELRAENATIHPAFMAQAGKALSR